MWTLQEAISYYQNQGAPADQNALISLLKEIQRENSGIAPYMLEEIASAYGIKTGVLQALIRRIPSLRMLDAHCLEICAGPNCGKYTALAAYAEKLQQKKGVTLKFVPCMRLCGKGPNIRWDGKLYHKADEALLQKLTEE